MSEPFPTVMANKVLKVGIISRDEYKKRTIAIAKGEYKPQRGEPKVWLTFAFHMKFPKKDLNINYPLKTNPLRYDIPGYVCHITLITYRFQ